MQGLLVGLIVLVAAVYAIWNLMPVSTRRNLALRAARGLSRSEQSGVRVRVADALRRIGQAEKGGCIDCPARWRVSAKPPSEDKHPRT